MSACHVTMQVIGKKEGKGRYTSFTGIMFALLSVILIAGNHPRHKGDCTTLWLCQLQHSECLLM
jgi:hypothetical protein